MTSFSDPPISSEMPPPEMPPPEWPPPPPDPSWAGATTRPPDWAPAGSWPGSWPGQSGGAGGGWPPGLSGPPWEPAPRRRRGGVALALVAVVVSAFIGLGIGSRWHRTVLVPTNTGQALSPSPFNSNNGNGGGATTSSAAAAIAAKVDPGVVDINTNLAYQNAAAAGTGMILTSSGEVLTNNHVIDGATSIRATVVTTGKTYTAKVVGEDPSDDVAVLQLQGASGLKTIELGDSAKVSVGSQVVAIGNAGGVGGMPSVVSGSVQALDQTITASDQGGGNAEQLSGLIQTNAPLQPGDSGGPLANASGQVIGMDTAASGSNRFESSSSVGFAIPIAKATSIAQQIVSGKGGGGVIIGVPGFLGVQVQDASAFGAAGATTSDGAAVAGVVSGSPAQQAGISRGDVITTVDGSSVGAAQDLTTVMRTHHPGDKVKIGWTDASGETHTATITLTTGPAA